MKKFKFLLIASFVLFMSIYTMGQTCEKDISTNSVNPENVPFAVAYPNLINPWLNTFDISSAQSTAPPVAENIRLNNNVIWQIPNWNQNIPLDMFNPFTSSGTPYDRYHYLWNNNIPFSESDFQWEDGWELLYLGTGYFPNGEEVNSINTTRIYSSGTTTMENPKIPYIILYNRYRGTMRVFMNLFAPFGPYDNLRIKTEFVSPIGISGIFRHLEAMDRPLDQTTNIKLIESFNPNSGGINRWFSADFQMGYDPCDCAKGNQIKFTINGLDSLNVNLYGRALATEIPLMENGQPSYDNDWLSLHDVNNGISGGNRIYTKFDGLIDDYKSDLTRYEQLSADYADYQSRKAILDAAKGFVVDGLNGLIPAAGSFMNFFVKQADDEEDPPNNFAKFIKGSSKGLLGYGYDQVSASLMKGSSAPKPPSMPVASYDEMRFAGTITSTSEPVIVGPFYIPGAFDESSLVGNLTAFNYPAYNINMGLVALLNTPSANIEFGQSSNTEIEFDNLDGCAYDRDVYVKNRFELRVKLDEELNIALNKSLDFDFDKTESFGGIEIEIKVPNNPAPDISQFNNLIGYNVNNNEHNIFVNLDYNIDGDRIIRLNSKWIPLNLLNQYVFSLKREDVFHFVEIILQPPVGSSCPEYVVSNHQDFEYEYEIVSVKLKLIHDMYFDQIGSSGEQINTTQIFSYFLYNPMENINLFGTNPNTWDQFQSGEMDQYTPGVLSIGTQTINTTNPLVSEVIGTDIYIRAEEVIIHGDISVQSGYNLTIEALTKIHVVPNSHLDQRIHLKIKRDFYTLPEFQIADNTEISNFCIGSDYQANVASRGLRRRMDEEIERNNQKLQSKYTETNTVSIHPNPANSQIWITSTSTPISEVQILDISGRVLIHEKSTNSDLHKISVNINSLQTGIYIVQTKCGDKSSTQKLVVEK